MILIRNIFAISGIVLNIFFHSMNVFSDNINYIYALGVSNLLIVVAVFIRSRNNRLLLEWVVSIFGMFMMMISYDVDNKFLHIIAYLVSLMFMFNFCFDYDKKHILKFLMTRVDKR